MKPPRGGSFFALCLSLRKNSKRPKGSDTMKLLTLRAAALMLGISDPTARKILAGYAIWIGNRRRYPIGIVERIAQKGTR